MTTKEDLAKVRQQLDIERRKSHQEFKARQEEKQVEAQRKASQRREREDKFRELGITDIFKMIVDDDMVDRGTVVEGSSEWESFVRITFGHKPSNHPYYDDTYIEVSANLRGNDNLEIRGKYTYETNLTTILTNGNLLWTKVTGSDRMGNYHRESQFEASILEVVGKVVVDPKSCGGGYNNY